MADKPIWEQIGSRFIQYDRNQLGTIYIDPSCLTWEGQQFLRKAAIVEKLSSLPFQKTQRSITVQNQQPMPDSCINSMVVGQLKADENPTVGFHQMFPLKNIANAWFCTNHTFKAFPAQPQLVSSQPSTFAVPLFSSSLYYSHSSRYSKYYTQTIRAVVGVGSVCCRYGGIVHDIWTLAASDKVCVEPAHILERLK